MNCNVQYSLYRVVSSNVVQFSLITICTARHLILLTHHRLGKNPPALPPPHPSPAPSTLHPFSAPPIPHTFSTLPHYHSSPPKPNSSTANPTTRVSKSHGLTVVRRRKILMTLCKILRFV